MSVQRRRPVFYALVAVVAIWLVAWGGYSIAKGAKVTAEKVAGYLHSVDLNKLSGGAREKALRELAEKMIALPVEERRRARMDGEWERWFQEMTDDEKGRFIEATLPSGFKQMLASFEQLPYDKRTNAIDRAMRDMRRAREELGRLEPGQTPWRTGTNAPELSPELQKKVVTLGLKSFYSESSAQTKAEMAPLLEEMQRTMESGRLFRQGR